MAGSYNDSTVESTGGASLPQNKTPDTPLESGRIYRVHIALWDILRTRPWVQIGGVVLVLFESEYTWQNYQPNADELKLLAQCRAESNVKGFVAAALGGGVVYQSIKSFNLSVSPKFGVWPKVGSACLFGFFVGKLMSIPSCYEKFKNLPNSPIGTYMRQRRGGRGESLPMETPDANLSFAVIEPPKYTSESQMNSAIDIDVYSSPSHMDSYTGDELNGPGFDISNDTQPNQNYVEKPTISYAELRRKNRENYLRADKEKYNLPSSVLNDTPAAQSTRRPAPSPPIEMKNQYGDVWE